jgi:succinate dehydrogenase / fumarate reductase membrane anchor subunit
MNAQLRDPLKRARGLGSAKNGVHHFVVQRLTAIALVPLGIWFLFVAVGLLRGDYASAHALVANPCNAILMVAFLAALFWHAQLGVQVIIEDYVHNLWLALPLQILVRFACVLGAVAGIFAVIRIALGN